MRQENRWAVRALLAGLAWIAWSGVGRGETGQVHRNAGNGLQMDVDTRWVSGGGYRPVKITVTPQFPVTADRTLHVEFFSGARFRSQDDYEVRAVQDIEIPEGSGPLNRIETTLSVPPNSGHEYRVRVTEDGKEMPRLSLGWTTSADQVGQTFDALPRILVVGASRPDTQTLSAALLPSVGQAPPPSPPGAYRPGNVAVYSLWSLMARPPADLPSKWIDYSNLDIVLISLDDLSGLKTQRPVALDAILRWTASGGNLVVYGLGNQWDRRAELDALLANPPGKAVDSERAPAGSWKQPEKQLFQQSVQVNLPTGTGYDYSDGAMIAATTPPILPPGAAQAKPRPRTPEPAVPDAVCSRQYDLGMVVALKRPDPFAASEAQWSGILGAIKSERYLWSRRHGISLLEDNPDFWNFLIPGVGLAPIGSFEVLITLFVLAIGPLNYVLLRRWKRLYLLVVTVPVSAAVVTFVLFAYAVVSDGLGTRVRARSFTHLDQRRGLAACWTRVSYYSGLSPRGGLRFPSDVMVVPIEAAPTEKTVRSRDIVWKEDQHMTAGWLPSRTPTQYLTVRSRPSSAGLRISPASDSPGSVEIENRLGTHIQCVVLRTEKGEYVWAQDLAADGKGVAKAVDEAAMQAVMQDVRKLYAGAVPQVPPGMNPQIANISRYRGRRYYYGPQYQMTGTLPTQATSRLEASLAAPYSSGSSGKGTAWLEPGSYLAIVDRSPEVELGTSAAQEESGFHVILGRW